MAEHILGPLYYERMGRAGPAMVFVHPNPMDQSCWMYQMAHLSTWYRCMAIDIPGYGRSPKATVGLSLSDLAHACWEAVDDALPGEPAVLVGCSAGSSIVPQMHHLRPLQTTALVLCGLGYAPDESFSQRVAGRLRDYGKEGIAFRWRYTFQDFSPAFRATQLAHFFADLFTERNDSADVPSIICAFQAVVARRPDTFFSSIACPTLILTGSEDDVHARAWAVRDEIPGCELRVLPGAGHACQLEQPWLFDRFMIEFLQRHGSFPGNRTAATSSASR